MPSSHSRCSSVMHGHELTTEKLSRACKLEAININEAEFPPESPKRYRVRAAPLR